MKARYFAAAICITLFIGAQSFQELAYRFWIPPSQSAKDDLLAHLLIIDRVRAIVVLGTIVLLIVPFVAIALRYFKAAPVSSVLGLLASTSFIGFEVLHRSIDFIVGAKWANQFAERASAAEQEEILGRFGVWTDVGRGLYFPLLLSFLFASCLFALVTWNDTRLGRWYYLGPIAYGLNALRLLGRLLSTYAGAVWLNGFNDKFYFPSIIIINVLLATWFSVLGRDAKPEYRAL